MSSTSSLLDWGVTVRNSAYGDTQGGVMRAGDHAADALGLVPVVLPNRASASLSSGSQSNGVAGNTRMDIFGSTHHTVIVFAPTLDVPIIQSELTTLDRSLRKASPSWEEDQTIDEEVLTDEAGHAYRGYVVEPQEVAAVVVRPDGVVGAIVRGVAGLKGYFEGVFGSMGAVRAVQDYFQYTQAN
ncbi:hypothetical protein EDD15DRAFT_2530436 [Pisolithus albus]|nr:hypothetical protein EDD15DRAFT_2530436 [Pisolithus albus]